MKIFEALSSASALAGVQWRSAMAAVSEEEGDLWRYLRERFTFIHQLGQAYRFEDYLQTIPSSQPPYGSSALDARPDATSRRAMVLALKALEQLPDPAQAPHVLLLINLLNFLADTG